MEQTMEEAAERARWQAVETVAWLVMMLAEERHDAQAHDGQFSKCDDLLCKKARQTYRDL